MDQLQIIQTFCKENIQRLYLCTSDTRDTIFTYELPLELSHIHDIFFCVVSRNFKIVIHNDIENSTKKRNIDQKYILKKKIIDFRVFCTNLFELQFGDHKSFLLQFIKCENREKQHLFTDDTTLDIHEYKLLYKMNHQPLCVSCYEPIYNKAVKYKCKHDYYHYLHFACKRQNDDERYFEYNNYTTSKACNCTYVAHIIQKQFRKSISAPNYTLCKNRLKREFNELITN